MAFSLVPAADGLSVALKFSGVTVATFDSTGKLNLIQNEGQLDMSLLNSKLLAVNGYQKLPGGLIIQWGTLNTSASGENPTMFPIAFPTFTLGVYASAGTATGSVQTLYASTVTATTNLTGFSARLWNGTTAQSGIIRWFAIGY